MAAHLRLIRVPGRRLVTGALLAGLVLGVAAIGSAGDGFTSPLIIPAAEFESSALWSWGTDDRFSASYGYVSSSADSLTCLMAPVIIPGGVTITKFEAAMWDLTVHDSGSQLTCNRFYPDVEVDLMSTYYDDNSYPQDSQVVTMASVSSSLDTGQTHIVSDTSVSDAWVNNITKVYWVRVYICGQFQGFQGVRIHYEE